MTVASHQITLNYSSMIFYDPFKYFQRHHHSGWPRYRQASVFDRARTGEYCGNNFEFIDCSLDRSSDYGLCQDTLPGSTHMISRLSPLPSALLYLNALYQLSDAFQVGAAAALRGYKDTRVPYVDGYYFPTGGIGLPLGLQFSF